MVFDNTLSWISSNAQLGVQLKFIPKDFSLQLLSAKTPKKTCKLPKALEKLTAQVLSMAVLGGK